MHRHHVQAVVIDLQAAEDALAAYRLTRLVTADTLTEPLRRRFIAWTFARSGQQLRVDDATGETVAEALHVAPINHGQQVPKLATLITCRWCAGVYVCVGVVIARRRFPRLWQPVAEAAALSAAAALLAGLED